MRMFVAVWPDAAVTESVAALRRPELDGVRWTTVDQWHVTLRFLGEVADERVPSLVDALRPVASRAGPVVASMGPVTDRFGGSILHVPVAGLGDLADDVIRSTTGFGDAEVEDRPFHGHLTLARIRRSSGRISPGRNRRRTRAEVAAELVGVPLSGTWTVDQLAVVASVRRPDRARYRNVAVLPLVGPASS